VDSKRGDADPFLQKAGMKSFLFYDRPVALNRKIHRDTLVKLPHGNYRFAAEALTAPLVTSEFFDVAVEYPILFAGNSDAELAPLALLGLRAGENLFVGADGQWQAPYIPASIRAYPFLLVGASDKPETWSTWVDQTSLVEGEGESGGESMFNNEGEESAVLKSANALMLAIETERARTRQFISRLQEHGLLKETAIQVVPENREPVSLTGVRVIDEARFLALDKGIVAQWQLDGTIGWVYAHLISLRNVQKLVKKLPAY
jgi:hypothetical protein